MKNKGAHQKNYCQGDGHPPWGGGVNWEISGGGGGGSTHTSAHATKRDVDMQTRGAKTPLAPT